MAEALLVVDVQRGFLHPQLPARNNDGAEEKMQKIMEDFRRSGREIIHIQHRGTIRAPSFTMRKILGSRADLSLVRGRRYLQKM